MLQKLKQCKGLAVLRSRVSQEELHIGVPMGGGSSLLFQARVTSVLGHCCPAHAGHLGRELPHPAAPHVAQMSVVSACGHKDSLHTWLHGSTSRCTLGSGCTGPAWRPLLGCLGYEYLRCLERCPGNILLVTASSTGQEQGKQPMKHETFLFSTSYHSQ